MSASVEVLARVVDTARKYFAETGRPLLLRDRRVSFYLKMSVLGPD
jgi:hypothetical protein